VATPEEFIVRIEPDGRIVLDGAGLHEESYRRIVALLEETVGPVRQIELAPGDPPTRHLHPFAEKEGAQAPRLELGQKGE
jgi:hypothetical protein